MSKKTFLVLFMAVTLVTGLAMPAHAQNVNPFGLQDGLNAASNVDPTLRALGGKSAAEIITIVINWLLSLVAILALAVLIWGSISYILSVGEEEKAKKAKRIILYAVVGLVLTGASFLIIKIVQDLLTK